MRHWNHTNLFANKSHLVQQKPFPATIYLTRKHFISVRKCLTLKENTTVIRKLAHLACCPSLVLQTLLPKLQVSLQ